VAVALNDQYTVNCMADPMVPRMSLSDWTIANPESAGLRSAPLRDLIEWLNGFGQANIHSVLVVRHGKLLFEHYRAGEDECWGEPLGNAAHGPDSKHDLRSVTKSVVSLLFGIALDRKLIRDITKLLSIVFHSIPTCAPRKRTAFRCAIC
jgi:CubicO group peptidase (beta-lactamase class C family)